MSRQLGNQTSRLKRAEQLVADRDTQLGRERRWFEAGTENARNNMGCVIRRLDARDLRGDCRDFGVEFVGRSAALKQAIWIPCRDDWRNNSQRLSVQLTTSIEVCTRNHGSYGA